MLPVFFSPSRVGVAAILVVASTDADAWAQSHPLTSRMSCAQAQGLVASQRGIVLNTGPFTYDRYVAGYGSCAGGETLDPAWVPTADTAQCPIGYRCISRSPPSRN